MKIINNIKRYCGAALLICAVSSVMLNSCKDNIDESDLYTFTGETMTDHFENNPEVFSSYLTVLSRVHLSKRSSSTLKELLDARGNYTCFAPTNEAIAAYIDSLYEIGETETKDLTEIPDSVAVDIAFNSIIEHGNQEAYMSTSFADAEPLPLTNMNGRYISPSFAVDLENNTLVYINLFSQVLDADIEVENGYIHTIDHVLSPSKASVAGMVMTTANTQLFGACIKNTGWDAKLTKWKDESWIEDHDDVCGQTYDGVNGGWEGLFPAERKYGYTIFVETDSVFKEKLFGDYQAEVTEAEFISALKEYVRAHNNFDDDTNRGNVTSWEYDYDNDYNWLNQFVAYHILPEKLTYTNMVTFANEYGFDASMLKDRTANQFSVNVWEYWETVGVQRRSIKITGCRVNGKIQRRINRKSYYNQGTYRELPASSEMPGILISPSNDEYTIDAQNGTYFPIDDILLWTADVPNKILNERLRYDITSLFPELLTNNIKQNRNNSWYFISDYLDNVYEIVTGTEFNYLPNTNYQTGLGSWMDYQIDEFNIRGQFDFTMKLPPVPYTGTYELRYGVWANNNRGMAQIYLGKNPRNLPAIGIPIDLREASGTNEASTGWVSEKSIAPAAKDSTALFENQKTMRNLGFMKGPKYIQVSGTTDGHNNTGRDSKNNLRKIIYTGQFEAGETYWIRFKSVLTSTSSEFFYDYIELVPKSVYAGENNEDIW